MPRNESHKHHVIFWHKQTYLLDYAQDSSCRYLMQNSMSGMPSKCVYNYNLHNAKESPVDLHWSIVKPLARYSVNGRIV